MKERLLKLREVLEAVKVNSWNPSNVDNLTVDALVCVSQLDDLADEFEQTKAELARTAEELDALKNPPVVKDEEEVH